MRDPQGHDEPMALRCTDQETEAAQMGEWCVLRWTENVGRGDGAHHFSRGPDLFSLVTLCAHPLGEGPSLPVRQAIWETKALLTFSETLADLRRHLWPSHFFRGRREMPTPFTFHERFSIPLWRRSLFLRRSPILSEPSGERPPLDLPAVETNCTRC